MIDDSKTRRKGKGGPVEGQEVRRDESAAAAGYARSLIEANLDPLVTIGPDGKITDVNMASEQATGLTRDRLVGTDFSDYFTKPDLARSGYQQVFREGVVRDYPLELRHRDGTVMPVLYNASIYRDDVVKNVPDDHVKIASGLGEVTPRFIIVTPFLHDADVVFKQRRILLVDDDMRNVFALSKILSGTYHDEYHVFNWMNLHEVRT